jgi:hypothetical protein
VKGCDYSWARPGGQALSQAGYQFVCRYLSPDNTGKNISPLEATDLLFHGLSIVLNWESTGTDMTYLNGVNDAHAAAAEAGAVGQPPDRPIYFSVDTDPHPIQAQIGAYFGGVVSVLGPERSGCYGGFVALQVAQAQGARWFWQANAWSPEGVFGPRQLYQTLQQDFGGSVDVDFSVADDFGQWPGPASLPPPAPPHQIAEHPGDNVRTIQATLQFEGGHGYVDIPGYQAAAVVGVNVVTLDPQITHAYTPVPVAQGVCNSSGGSGNARLVFGGMAADGNYGLIVQVAA